MIFKKPSYNKCSAHVTVLTSLLKIIIIIIQFGSKIILFAVSLPLTSIKGACLSYFQFCNVITTLSYDPQILILRIWIHVLCEGCCLSHNPNLLFFLTWCWLDVTLKSIQCRFASTLGLSTQVKDDRVKMRTKHYFRNICWVMIDSQDQHNHNEIPSKSHLIDLNNTVKRFLPGQC